MRTRMPIWFVAALLAVPSSAHALVVVGKQWFQPAATYGLTWPEINGVCGSGYCSGGSGKLAILNGWYWATNEDLQVLFEELILPGSIQFPTSTWVYGEVGSADIDAAIGPGAFAPSYLVDGGEIVGGFSRDLMPVEGFAYAPYLSDQFEPAAIDNAVLGGGGSFDSPFGAWLYRPVPEPSTLMLFVLGLIVLVLRRVVDAVSALVAR
jgi:hypothetical protein